MRMAKTTTRGKRKAAPVSGTLRRVLAESGRSLNRISKEAGVPYASLWRFRAGQGSPSAEILDRLALYFGMQLVRAGDTEGDL
jgi:hypothetical protein